VILSGINYILRFTSLPANLRETCISINRTTKTLIWQLPEKPGCSSIVVNKFIMKYAAVLVGAFLSFGAMAQSSGPVKNIVLVHGAFADASGWEGVYKLLSAKGYNVIAVQNPLSSLEDDVASVDRVLEKLEGPVILVGHSWGGAVISQAGASSKVVGLVYVAAFQPDAGENVLKWATAAPPAPENGIMPPDDKGYVYFDKAKYHAGFCADLPADKAAFMYASQGAWSVKCLATPLTAAAWKSKPSWAIVATEDKAINPDTERQMYKRAGSVVTEIKASHVVFVSQPRAVAAVIEAAAKGAVAK
jgi:pimeloyl-ACP methyl ester carboxylesterase